MTSLTRQTKSHKVTPQKRPEKFISLHEGQNVRQVIFPSNYLNIIQLNAGLMSRQQEKSVSKQKSSSISKSPHIFPFLSIPQSFKRPERKTDGSISNPSLQCHQIHIRNEVSLHEKMRQILLKPKDQNAVQKRVSRVSRKQYKLSKPGKFFALKKTDNVYSMVVAYKELKDIQKAKESFQKIPQKSQKALQDALQNGVANREMRLPKLPPLRKKRIQTHHVKVL